MRIIGGADGCRAGWICVTWDRDTGVIRSGLYPDANKLIFQEPELAVLALDIPIGLSEAGPRLCDQEARRRLAPLRHRSVFPPAIRSVLHAKTRAKASTLTQRTDGRRVSAQAWAIVPKIREVDAILSAQPQLQGRVREAHPELSFWAWNGNRPMAFGKRTRAGREERVRRVRRSFRNAFESIRRLYRATDVADDDILDALALLWTARRIECGISESLPKKPLMDEAGLRMEIVY
jgi:predicted RNase H-like nuclease